MSDGAGWLPLHEACNHGYAEIVAYLLDHGASVDAAGPGDMTPLIDACEGGNMNIVTLLLERGANPHLRDDQVRVARKVVLIL